MEKRTAAHSQLQATISQLLESTNQGKLMQKLQQLLPVLVFKIENQDRQQLLEVRQEEAEKTRRLEYEMAELYLKVVIVQQSNNFGMNFNQQSQIYSVKFPQNVQPSPHPLSNYMLPSMSPSYGFPRSIPPSVYPTNNVTSKLLRPGSRDDLNLLL